MITRPHPQLIALRDQMLEKRQPSWQEPQA
jgi:hypothetical protein